MVVRRRDECLPEARFMEHYMGVSKVKMRGEVSTEDAVWYDLKRYKQPSLESMCVGPPSTP